MILSRNSIAFVNPSLFAIVYVIVVLWYIDLLCKSFSEIGRWTIDKHVNDFLLVGFGVLTSENARKANCAL